jgi:DNA polymerase-3 subunit alpha
MYLNCKTNFSFLYGTFKTRELVETATAQGVTSLALTNINSTCDLWEFVKLCGKAHIKPVAGVEFRNGDKLLYILLAANNRGLAWIHSFLSEYLLEKKSFPEAGPELNFFADSWDGFAIYPFGAKSPEDLVPNERIGLLPSELTKLFSIDLRMHAGRFVIRQPVTVQDRQHFSLHRLLRCIAKNTILAKLKADEQCESTETFISPAELLDRFKAFPFIVTNTYRLMDACRIEMDFAADKTMRTYCGTEEEDRVFLEKLATEGLEKRFGTGNKEAGERLNKELKIINDLGFTSYFLINWDIIRYARLRNYYWVGRGSGANSIVAYCLFITNVNPIQLNLYFERFLNLQRLSPPDFDIDFSHTDRDDVMDYIFKRYGRDHVALLGSFPTFRQDSIIRQLGKVLGLPDNEIVQLQRTGRPTDNNGKLILQYGRLMQGFPGYPSLHPCGILICQEPVSRYATLFMPPKGLPTVQMDMFTAEDIGLNKFDVLSQRGLSHIREAQRLIRENRGVSIDIRDVEKFKKDKEVAAQIREANSIGCFYIESPAMRQLLKKLRCDDYITLVAASSIIRPGVAQSGMMREYIYRYHHRDGIKYLHPLFEEHLSETFGVMVFQEDVIKIAHYYGGLDLGKADILRRAMSGKYPSNNEFRMIKAEFFGSARQLGRDETVTAEIWRQMESFAGYSFNKAHSASYAAESYMSLYLKTWYVKEFMVAVINNFGGFYSTELYFLELLKTGDDIEPPCINNSDEHTNIQGGTVYVGFVHIKRLQDKLVERLLQERRTNGHYLHLQDFIERTNIGIDQLDTLISIGAFRFTGKSKKQLLWEANFLQKKNQPQLHNGPVLFQEPPVEFILPDLPDNRLDDLYDQMEILGFPLSNPFELVDDDPEKYIKAADLEKNKGRTVSALTYFISRKQTVTRNNDEMFFGTFVDCGLNWIDTVHFPDSARNFPLRDTGFYRITGRVVEDFGVFSIEVHKMEKAGHKKRIYESIG